MKTSKKLSEKLNQYMTKKDDLQIKEWMFDFSEGSAISLGIDNNKIGGPYTPPVSRDIYIGTAHIRWADERISFPKIDTQALENLDKAMEEWRKASYADPEYPELLEPLPIPADLKIKDEKIVDLVTKDSSYLFEILEFYNKELSKKDYTKTIDAEVGANFTQEIIMNSKGLNTNWKETVMRTYVYVNSQFGDSYGKRKLLGPKELKTMMKEIDRYMMHSKKSREMKSGKLPVILTPGVFESFLGMYLTQHLNGESIANNKSIYNIEDFKTKKQVFNEKLNFVIDGLKEYATSTTPCSVTGIPATKQYVIANGRLITPLTGLKYAKKLGVQPTPPGVIYPEIDKKSPYSQLIKELDYGLIVYGILGMHTQDPSEGRYCLTVNQGLLVENGKIEGTIKDAIITGNFFETLKNKKTKFAKYSEDELAIKTEADITAS